MSRLSDASPSTASAATGSVGLLPQLYQHAVGPQGAAYYHQLFTRFETLGRPSLSWNHGAGFFTLGWCAMRGLWRHAGVYAAVLLALLLAWGLGLHGRLPASAEAALLLSALVLLYAVPGFLGNRWYYEQVHRQAIHAIEQSSTIDQASTVLQQYAVTPKHVQIIGASYAATMLLLGSGLLWWSSTPSSPSITAAANTATAQPKPPVLHFPNEPAVPAAPEPSAVKPATAPATAAPTPIPQPPAPLPAAATAVQEPAPAPTTPIATPTPVSPATSPEPTTPTGLQIGRFYVQLGSYGSDANADVVEQQVRQLGYSTLRDTGRSAKGYWVRLRAGPFNNQAEANAAQQKLKGQRLGGTVFQYRP